MFDLHGKFIVSRWGNIIEVHAHGPFNNEAIEDYQEDVLAELKTINPHWGMLVFMHKNCLTTPEGGEKLKEHAKILQDLGLKAIALIFTDEEPIQFVKDNLTNFYQYLGITAQFFQQQVAAQQWLDAQLAPMEQDSLPRE